MKKNLIGKIEEIVSSTKRNDGWSPMAEIGLMFRENGIDIKDYGYMKLKPFFESLSDYFVIETDNSTNLPIIKSKNTEVSPGSGFNLYNGNTTHLTQWANINQRRAVDSLKRMALPECWSYGCANTSYPNPILAKYLKWTFVKLMRENKVLFSRNYASFNTGLVDKFYKPIYAVFDKNKYDKQPWHFIDFCVAGGSSTAARILTDNFSELPQRAMYIQKYDDVIYDTSLPVDVNWEHIIIENIDRMPIELLHQVCSGCIEVKEAKNLDEYDRAQYYADFKNVLESNPMKLSIITGIMGMAVENAKHRVAWNYKTAIPVYYPTDDSVHLILPLALNINEPEKISIALVMTKTPSNRYRAVTIFTLDMAYSNARLVTKPSSDWLIAETINSCN